MDQSADLEFLKRATAAIRGASADLKSDNADAYIAKCHRLGAAFDALVEEVGVVDLVGWLSDYCQEQDVLSAGDYARAEDFRLAANILCTARGAIDLDYGSRRRA